MVFNLNVKGYSMVDDNVRKTILFYLKESSQNNIFLKNKDFINFFIDDCKPLLNKVISYELGDVQSSDFECMNNLLSLNFIIRDSVNDRAKIVFKNNKYLSTFKINDFIYNKMLLVFNENESLYFELKSKKKKNHKVSGIIHPKENYISVFFSKLNYKHQVTSYNGMLESYTYNGDVKVKEVKNYFNNNFIDYRKRVFDFPTGVPVESEVYLFRKRYFIKQTIGSDCHTNIDVNESKASEIFDFILELKGDFIIDVNENDLTMFNIYFPSENHLNDDKIPF